MLIDVAKNMNEIRTPMLGRGPYLIYYTGLFVVSVPGWWISCR